jgi:hypothetical protein
VDVGHLDRGEQREQGETQDYGRPGCMLHPAATASVIWLESRQSTILNSRIHSI